jgi:hypothetical protein
MEFTKYSVETGSVYSLLVTTCLKSNLLFKACKILNFKIPSTSPVYAHMRAVFCLSVVLLRDTCILYVLGPGVYSASNRNEY